MAHHVASWHFGTLLNTGSPSSRTIPNVQTGSGPGRAMQITIWRRIDRLPDIEATIGGESMTVQGSDQAFPNDANTGIRGACRIGLTVEGLQDLVLTCQNPTNNSPIYVCVEVIDEVDTGQSAPTPTVASGTSDTSSVTQASATGRQVVVTHLMNSGGGDPNALTPTGWTVPEENGNPQFGGGFGFATGYAAGAASVQCDGEWFDVATPQSGGWVALAFDYLSAAAGESASGGGSSSGTAAATKSPAAPGAGASAGTAAATKLAAALGLGVALGVASASLYVSASGGGASAGTASATKHAAASGTGSSSGTASVAGTAAASGGGASAGTAAAIKYAVAPGVGASLGVGSAVKHGSAAGAGSSSGTAAAFDGTLSASGGGTSSGSAAATKQGAASGGGASTGSAEASGDLPVLVHPLAIAWGPFDKALELGAWQKTFSFEDPSMSTLQIIQGDTAGAIPFTVSDANGAISLTGRTVEVWLREVDTGALVGPIECDVTDAAAGAAEIPAAARESWAPGLYEVRAFVDGDGVDIAPTGDPRYIEIRPTWVAP